MWGQRKAETEVWDSGTARAALHPVTEGPWLAKRKEQVVTQVKVRILHCCNVYDTPKMQFCTWIFFKKNFAFIYLFVVCLFLRQGLSM